MRLTIIAALGSNFVIGDKNGLPWKCKEDLEWFKENTIHKTMIMGRKTFQSLKRPLAHRETIVLSRDPTISLPPGVSQFLSLDSALEHLERSPLMLVQQGYGQFSIEDRQDDEIMICGGAQIYEMALPLVEKMLLTYIEGDFRGDSYFPRLDYDQWQIKTIKEGTDEGSALNYTIYEFTRTK